MTKLSVGVSVTLQDAKTHGYSSIKKMLHVTGPSIDLVQLIAIKTERRMPEAQASMFS